MKVDYHIHGTFSSDAHSETEEIVRKALECGYDEIAFTEHFDLLPSEIAVYGIPPYPKYQRQIKDLRKKYPSIRILLGIEAGELHLAKSLYEQITQNKKPDILIASIHLLSNEKNTSVPFKNPLTKEEIRDYYNENLKLVQQCDFDILGHLGIYKRYYPEHPIEDDSSLDIIKEIFRTMIERDIALEINYSSLRKTLHELLPEPLHLELFQQMGGKLLTLGSDSHHVDQFDDHYWDAVERIRNLGITQLYRKADGYWQPYQI